jgi:biopolymer transport protein ExbB
VVSLEVVNKAAGPRRSRPLLLAAVALAVACCTEGSWDLLERNVHDVEFAYRVVLTIDNTSGGENLYDVPVLVTLTPARFHYDHLVRGGEDIAFYGADGGVLAHEVEAWDPLGTSLLWVRVPMIAAGATTTVQIRYGSRLRGEPERPADVWSNGYLAVWHLAESAGPYYDSSGRGAGLVGAGAPPPAPVAGLAGVGQSLAANNAGLVFPAGPALADLEPLTFEAWVSPAAGAANGDRLLTKGPYSLSVSNAGTRELRFDVVYTGNDLSRSWDSCWDTTPGAWTYLALTWEGGKSFPSVRLYRDGALHVQFVFQDDATGTHGDGAGNDLCVGNSGAAGTSCLAGGYDEVRISSNARSPEWLRVQYASIEDTLITYGPEESVAP